VVAVGSAVSTGVDSERLSPTRLRLRERMFHATFQSLSAVNPHDGQECSRTHSGLSASTPHAAHSLVVPAGSTATKCVPSCSHLYSSNERNIRHAADAVLRLFDGDSIIASTFRSSTAMNEQSCCGEGERYPQLYCREILQTCRVVVKYS